MKNLWIVLYVLFALLAHAQTLDTITLHHKRYYTLFDKQKRYPLMVQWKVKKADIDCETKVKRHNNFRPDSLLFPETNNLNDYKKSGYDKGHNMPAADCRCDPVAMSESFYLSNISPQTPQLNRQTWNDLEETTRQLAEKHQTVSVFCGCIGIEKRIGKVAVPSLCWKVLLYNSISTAFLFPNETSVTKYPYTHYQVPLDSIFHIAPWSKKNILHERTKLRN